MFCALNETVKELWIVRLVIMKNVMPHIQIGGGCENEGE